MSCIYYDLYHFLEFSSKYLVKIIFLTIIYEIIT